VTERALRPAVFLDRDGTILEEVGYLNHLSRFRMLSGAAGAIRRLNEAALPVIVVTNQSGIARGYFPESLVSEVHQRLTEELQREGARVDAFYHCHHASSAGCECRKPKTGMLDRAAQELGLNLAGSFVIGDRQGDVETAYNAGARGILVRTGYGEGELAWHVAGWPRQPHHVALDLSAAVDWILRERNSGGQAE